MRTYSIQNELSEALFRLSFGKLSYDEANAQARKHAGKFDLNDRMLAHKGIHWFAKEILKKMES